MKTSPAISIITPVWNGLPLIKQCISSVMAQDFKNWELIVSDNGSTDGTCEYLDTLSDLRIRVFKQQENLGIMGNVNFLFSQARAPLSQILCADDYFLSPHSLSEIMEYWSTAPAEIGLAGFGFPEVKYPEIHNTEKGIPAVLKPTRANIWFFTFGNFLGNLSNLSLRTHLIAETGFFHPSMNFAGDFEFWTRLSQKVSIGINRKPVIYVREHPKSASNRNLFKGILLEQQVPIYEKLILELSPFCSRRKLIAYFNYEICSMHYRFALKAAFKGRCTYFKKLFHIHSGILWPKWKQLTICLPIAILNIRNRVTYPMGIDLINEQLAQQIQIKNR